LNQEDKQTTLELLPGQIDDLKRRIDAGESGLADQLEKLLRLQAALQADLEREDDEGEDPLLTRLKVKRRPYTLSEAALEARRKNAQKSTGPKTEEGKAASSRNGWKHGQYARRRVLGMGKPCRTTCVKYPCSLVNDGDVRPGADCLDKEYFLTTLAALSKALEQGELSDLKSVVTLQLGGTLQVIEELQASILENGVYMKSEKLNKNGEVIGFELKPNPSLLPLSNLLKAAGLTMPDFMITPAAVERKRGDEEAVQSVTDIFRMAAEGLGKPKGDG